ncbi:MAG: glycosyltransferase family 4 protein [Pseudobdellovibrionaceae bacterium]|nr:glycosyltransferase family 4 protein [Bdellovibrionales bacterium]USN48424.1 MAG: glycosyltransferase family 4 protein [Pseudobdellovibrionaceae bacterium]
MEAPIDRSASSDSVKKISILYVVPNSGVGGVETFLKSTWKHHDPQKFSPSYAVFRPGPLTEWLRQNKAPVYQCPFIPRLRRPDHYIKTVLWLKTVAEKTGADLVHSSMAYAALFAGPATSLTKVHHIWFQHGPVGGWMDQLAATLPHKLLLVNSQHTLKEQQRVERTISVFIPSGRQVKVLALGSDDPRDTLYLADVEQMKKTLQISEDDFVVGMLCRLQPWKGVHLLIEALKHIKKTKPTLKIVAVIWGEPLDTPYAQQLIAESESCGLNVKWPGFTAQSSTALANLHVLVNASTTPEPFGLTLTEAMALGKPVIAPKSGGPLDIVKAPDTGLLFEPGDAHDLSEKLVLLASSPERRKEMGHQAQLRAQKLFSAARMMNDLENLCLETLAQGKK